MPTAVRLRRLLKTLLRAYGFRCEGIEPVKLKEAAADRAMTR